MEMPRAAQQPGDFIDNAGTATSTATEARPHDDDAMQTPVRRATHSTPRRPERWTWTGYIWGRRHYHNLDYICIDERSTTRRTHGHVAEVPALKSDNRWAEETLRLAEPYCAPDEHRRRTRPKPIRWRLRDSRKPKADLTDVTEALQ